MVALDLVSFFFLVSLHAVMCRDPLDNHRHVLRGSAQDLLCVPQGGVGGGDCKLWMTKLQSVRKTREAALALMLMSGRFL